MASRAMTFLMVAAITSSAAAQGGSPPGPPPGQSRGRPPQGNPSEGVSQPGMPPQGNPQQGRLPARGMQGPGPLKRAQLEQQVRERLGNRLKMELGLSDVQIAKVAETNRKFEEKHRILLDQERDVRMSIRDEMIRGDTTRQAQVGALLDRIIRNERQRVDLMEQEQKDLATVLTPVQRAKYFGIQEAVRKRMQQMRQQKMQGQPPVDDGNGGMEPGAMGGQPGGPMPFRPNGQLKKRPLGGVPQQP